MLSVIETFGVPTWLKLPPDEDIPADEKRALDVLEALRLDDLPEYKNKSEGEINETLEYLKAHGKKCFQEKKYGYAIHIYIVAMKLPSLDRVIRSQLYSNVAIGFLKLELPHICCLFSFQAIVFNENNIKARYCLAMSNYLLYRFSDALTQISCGLAIDPKCFELRDLKEKVLRNKIVYKFSRDVICARINLFDGSTPGLILDKPPCLDVKRLIMFDIENNPRLFLLESEEVISSLLGQLKYYKEAHRFDRAYQILIDLEHILFVRSVKYDGCIKFYILFLLTNKIYCLYRMERYEDALEVANEAKKFVKPTIDDMILEVKIYHKLNKPAEAIALTNEWFDALKKNPVQFLIIEELLYLLSFPNKTTEGLIKSSSKLYAHWNSKSQNLISNSQIKRKSAKQCQNDVTSGSSQKKNMNKNQQVAAVNSSGEKEEEGPGTWCSICNVKIPVSEASWPIHLAGRKHKNRAINVEAASNHKISNGTRECKNGSVENNSKVGMDASKLSTIKPLSSALASSSSSSSTTSSSTSLSSSLSLGNGNFTKKPSIKKSSKNVQKTSVKVISAKNHKISNGNQDCKNGSVENNSKVGKDASKLSTIKPLSSALASSSSSSSSSSTTSSSSSLCNGNLTKKPTEKKSSKKLQDTGRKAVPAKNLPSGKNKRTFTGCFRWCHSCNVKIGNTKQIWDEHVKGKKHQECIKKKQEMSTKMKNNDSSKDDIARLSSKDHISKHKITCDSKDEEFFTAPEEVSDSSSSQGHPPRREGPTCTNKNISKNEEVISIRDEKLEMPDDVLTFSEVKPEKKNRRKKQTDKNFKEVENLATVKKDEHIVDKINGQNITSNHADLVTIEEEQNVGWKNVDKKTKIVNNSQTRNDIFVILSSSEAFPLQENSYNIILLCQACIKSPDRCKDCPENLLYVQNKRTGDWVAIRERNDQGYFFGKYRICTNSIPCFRGSVCCFAHSLEEEIIWNKEKDNKFSIREFIKRHRKRLIPECEAIKLIYDKFPGLLSYNCGECYMINKSLIGKADDDLYCSKKAGKHNWSKSKIIIHRNKWNEKLTPVYPYPGKQASGVCWDGAFCNKKFGKCLKAHSQLEKEIWMFFDEIKSNELEFLVKFNDLNNSCQKKAPNSRNQMSKLNPPHVVKKICPLCWTKQRVSYERPGLKTCSAGHEWIYGCDMFYILPARQQLRHLPRVFPRGNEFMICRTVLKKKECERSDCQFAHSQEELETWKWMADTGCHDPGLVAKKCESSTNVAMVIKTPEVLKPRPVKTWSTIPQVEAYKIQKEENHYCPFCEKLFSSKNDLEIHRNMPKHMENVKSDSCMQWNYRTPPFNPKFELCPSNEQGRCYYSNVPSENNLCTRAHSQEELDEWNERKRWKAVKWNNAEREHLLSMASKLMKKYEESEAKMDVIVSHVDGIEIIVDDDMTFRSTNKKCHHIWSFEITSKTRLKMVYLLKEECRNNFSLLQDPEGHDKQYIQGELLVHKGSSVRCKVFLKFVCNMFGSFSQVVTFDFGGFPVVCKNLKCEVGSRGYLEKLETIKLNMSLNRWTSKDQKIISYQESNDEVMSSLMRKYSSKDIDEILADDPILIPLHKGTYKRKMHGLLYMEELTQIEIISRYNLETVIALDNKFKSSIGGIQMCQDGDLYGTILLSNLVIEGSLMLKSVNKVLLKPLRRSHYDYVRPSIYEASIPEFEERTMKNMTGESVIILIDTRCCAELGLKPGDELKAEVQFQLDRESFCRMHYALDNLKFMQFVFPDLEDARDQQIGLGIGLHELNAKQNEVLGYALRQGNEVLPPLVVFGPFGTGKTETLAKTALFLAERKTESKILICTKTNMTADEYFKRYFCNVSSLKIIRIYNTERRIETVDRVVLPFCILDKKERKFNRASTEDLKSSQIIVTTLEMSFCLREVGESCRFTHIFVDEAGQDLECRTIIPLMVANKNTCIIIAGDHRQMGEEVFSCDVRNQNFSCSLMERLLQHYRKLKSFKQIPQILLNENYRNHKEILAFISQLYYGSRDSLISKHVELQSWLKPLEFFAVSGEEVVDKESASIYNLAEVEEVVERVSFLLENWPESWGKRDASEILVTSPYMDQIRLIRSALRKKSHMMASVVVIRVHNVPGLEFRAMFVSTVRTNDQSLWNELESEGFDDSFLSQPKLLNSAFTRAKSYLAVVGDPFTLCTAGECSKIWIEFLVKCDELNSINPKEMTLEIIKSACSSKSSKSCAIYNEIQEESEMNETYDDKDWQGGFRLKSDDIVDQLIVEYSNKETYGFKLTLQESTNDGHREIHSNASNFVDFDLNSERQSPNDGDMHKCRFHIIGCHRYVARPHEYLGYEIIIPTRKHCRTALDGDDVVVSIINQENVDNLKNAVYGEVVGLIKRKVEVRDRRFICFIDGHNLDIMIPINKKIPKIKIVTSDHARESRSHVSIYNLVNNKLRHTRDVPVNFCDPHSNLYLVNLLHWERHYNNPLGVVLQTIKPGVTMEEGMHILDLEHNIPQPLEASCPKRSTNIDNREDCTDLLVFTIDGDKTEDIDDAIGFEMTDQGCVCLSIHIADVSFYIDANSPLDEIIKERSTSFYPPNRSPVHMLPENFGTDLCSLKEGVERLALSVFIPLDSKGNFDHEEVSIKRTRIKSKYRLTYEEVDSILNNDISSSRPPQLIIALKKINEISTKWRHDRLGSDSMQWITDIFAMDGPISRQLIAELMIQANRIVAQFLLQNLPTCTPLRVQIPPDEKELEKWRQEFKSIVFESYGLRRYFKTFPNVCICEGFCSCVETTQRIYIDVPKTVYNEIANAFQVNTDILKSIVRDLDKFPQTFIAQNFLQRLQESSEYVCSGSTGSKHKIHFSLNLNAYTHFTSPIRRYIDIVVHRLLIDCIESKPPTYTTREVAEICAHCTLMNKSIRDYDKAANSALICTFLQDRPLRIDTVISKIDSKFQIDLHSMIFKSQFSVKPNFLSLDKLPERLVGSDIVTLSWNKRIYDVYPDINPDLTRCEKKNIDPCRLVINVKPSEWLNFLTLEDGNISKQINDKIISRDKDNFILSSENLVGLSQSHYCNFSLQLKPGNMIEVQLSSKLDRGLLVPFVQSISITKLTSICIEHNSDPVRCFSQVPSKVASKESYTSLIEYKQLWKSTLSVESAYNSVMGGVPAVICNVQIEWDFENMNTSGIFGQFHLDKNFCDERGLNVFSQTKDNLVEHKKTMNSSDTPIFICVQYPDTVLNTSSANYKIRNILKKKQTVNLILHCLIEESKEYNINDKKKIQFLFSVKQQSFKFSSEIIENLRDGNRLATIEWIEQNLPMRRMLEAIECLNPRLELAENIALNKNISVPGIKSEVKITWPDNVLKPNSIQEKAIKLSISSPFSLIQGPPGTGKTYVVAHMVNQFYNLNKDTEDQIMCCGPSNKSADVITSALLKLNPHLEILRVCSKAVENKCYPLSLQSCFIKEKIKLADEVTDDRLKNYTLHHLIRNPDRCPLAKEILKLEAELNSITNTTKSKRENKELMEYNKLKREYKGLKREAEDLFLEPARIIVATCTGSGASKFESLKIKQLLIDECAMCMEPESMVPIVRTQARQIILIGDHKQLRPIITNKYAAKAGLETSLFQRYNKNAFMLTKQYRMHHAIAEFPSKQFYNGKLTVGTDNQKKPSNLNIWPGGRDMPTVFVHIGGSEESLAASNEEGGVSSKKNRIQVEFAVHCAFKLIHKFKVKPEDIIILSQYRAQCTAIFKLLKEKNLSSVTVSTVIASQGSERKYVILSTVRSLPKHEIEKCPGRTWKEKNLGFVIDPHQINVALTRAKDGLIILGNKDLLSVDKMWSDLIDHYEERGAMVMKENFPLFY